MDKSGASTSFLACKIGVAFVAIAFIGIAFSMYDSSARFSDRQNSELIVNVISRTIEEIDQFPGEVELRRELPVNAGHFEVLLTGEQRGEIQLVHVCVTSISKAERLLAFTTIVNGGDFMIFMENPREIIARKSNTIRVELV